MTAIENKAIIRAFVDEVINQGRLERADDLVVPDFVELDPLPGQRLGREGLKEIISGIRAAFPDISWVMQEMVAEGDLVFSRFTWSGTHLGTFLGIPATGKQVNVSGMVLDRLVAGRMAESRILMNNMVMMQQLGVIPGAPEAK